MISYARIHQITYVALPVLVFVSPSVYKDVVLLVLERTCVLHYVSRIDGHEHHYSYLDLYLALDLDPDLEPVCYEVPNL